MICFVCNIKKIFKYTIIVTIIINTLIIYNIFSFSLSASSNAIEVNLNFSSISNCVSIFFLFLLLIKSVVNCPQPASISIPLRVLGVQVIPSNLKNNSGKKSNNYKDICFNNGKINKEVRKTEKI